MGGNWAGVAAGFGLVAVSASALASPRAERAEFGRTDSGAAVHVFTLTNDHGASVRVLDLGGTVIELNVPDRRGVAANVVPRLADLKAYRATATLNALVGRYANRLKNGFDLDGGHYALTANPQGVTLHGGRDPYGARLWSAAMSTGPDSASVALSLVSPDSDQGFPGAVTIKVTYTLTNANALRLDYEAVTDKPTVVNLTNHIYFNLSGSGAASVHDHRLEVFADQFTLVDADSVPTGILAPVAGTALDFRQPRSIGQRIRSSEPQMLIGRGYDHNFVLRKPAGDPLPLAARLYDPASGRILELRTTEPGLQVYSSNGMNGTLVNATGHTIRQGDLVALETQHFPNSPNTPAFPSTVLRPGQVLRSTTVFRFTTDKAHPPR